MVFRGALRPDHIPLGNVGVLFPRSQPTNEGLVHSRHSRKLVLPDIVESFKVGIFVEALGEHIPNGLEHLVDL